MNGSRQAATGELLVVFDYSGTLSLDAVAFARPASLAGELYRSGLADFGVATPETFWNRIVNPTWEEGSLGVAPYRRLIVREVCAGWSEERRKTSRASLERAAAMFVTRYLASSLIHPAWHHLLRGLVEESRVAVVAATDHYAEATTAIGHHFKTLGIQARPLSAAKTPSERNVYIANSADLAYRKDQEGFWRCLRQGIGEAAGGDVLLIDDFGANEAAGDDYGRREKVAERQRRTATILAKVFPGRVTILPFVLPDTEGRPEETTSLIEAVSSRIIGIVYGSDPSRQLERP